MSDEQELTDALKHLNYYMGRTAQAEAEVVGLRYKLDHECAALLECQCERERLQAEVERLRAENEKDLADMTRALDVMATEVERLRSDIKAAYASVDLEAKKRDEAEAEVAQTEHKWQLKYDALWDEANGYKTEVERLQAEMSQERNRANLSSGLVGDLKAEVERLREDRKDYAEAAFSRDDTINDLRAEVERLRGLILDWWEAKRLELWDAEAKLARVVEALGDFDWDEYGTPTAWPMRERVDALLDAEAPLCDGSCGAKPSGPHRHFDGRSAAAKGE